MSDSSEDTERLEVDADNTKKKEMPQKKVEENQEDEKATSSSSEPGDTHTDTSLKGNHEQKNDENEGIGTEITDQVAQTFSKDDDIGEKKDLVNVETEDEPKVDEELHEEVVTIVEDKFETLIRKQETKEIKIGPIKKFFILVMFFYGLFGAILSLIQMGLIANDINYRLPGFDFFNGFANKLIPIGDWALLTTNFFALVILVFMAYIDSKLLK